MENLLEITCPLLGFGDDTHIKITVIINKIQNHDEHHLNISSEIRSHRQ